MHLDLARELGLYFDIIYVPRAVQVEVNRKQRFRYKLQKLYKMGIFARCTSVDKWNVEILRTEVDEGEAEGLVQAQERHAAIFIGDERRAREIGEALGLRPVGTVRILARLHLEGRAGETKALVGKLRQDLSFRVSDRIIRAAIAQAQDPI